MATQKPDLTRVWANGAPPANVVDPDTTTPGKVDTGWQAEVPPFEHFNFLQKWFTQGLAHFNEQGVGVWDTDTTYPIGGFAKGSDGNVYKAILEQDGNDPVSDNGENWYKYISQVNIREFGAIGDNSTDNLSAINSAISSLPLGGEIIFPDDSGSNYLVSSKPTGGGAGFVFTFLGNAKITDNANYPNGTNVLGFNQQGTETSYKLIRVLGDEVDQPSISGSKVNGFKVLHQFGGANAAGGRHAAYDVLNHSSATSLSNTDRNYVATVGQALGNSNNGDGGTDTGPGALGALFAANFITNAFSGYTNTLNITGGEVNTKIDSGASTKIHSIWQLVTDDSVKGDQVDAGLLITAKAPAVGLSHAILIADSNGGNPVDPVSGTILGTESIVLPRSTYRGIDFTGYDFTNNVFSSRSFTVASDGSLEVGNPNTVQTCTIDLHSSGTGNDYDIRILSLGGSATPGQGTAQYQAGQHLFNSVVRASSDNNIDLGAPSFRWREIFAGNGTINTSDERFKTDISDIPDNVLDAWSEVPKRRYKWIESKSEKGNEARWHVGVIAQDIVNAFESKGLDATEWGVLCFDEWEEQIIEYPEEKGVSKLEDGTVEKEPLLDEKGNQVILSVEEEILDENGEPTGETTIRNTPQYQAKIITIKEAYSEIIEGGERYGVRYSQAAQLDSALERRERAKLEAKIEELINVQTK